MIVGVEEGVKILDNPFLQQILTELRSKYTRCGRFRELLKIVGFLSAYEIARLLEVEEVNVETPLNVVTKGNKIKDFNNIVLIAILRASIPMVQGALKIFNNARVGFISAKRVESEMPKNLEMEVIIDYINLPDLNDHIVIIMDPMLATGSTLIEVIKRIKKRGNPKMIIISSVISTEAGINRVKSQYGDVIFTTLAIDEKLNSKGFIVPGLGDAGDRAFNC